MEQHMNIDLRWTVNHSEYQKTAEYIANLKYEKALDHLQTLVIKRLFELHKLNLFQTGYQMPITHYNNLAVPLGKPTLDWTKVSHYAFLNDFYLL
ncbi:hypothetical protein C0995_001777 [Termitomyces sp. Mi166|nr:hypothetical protein C0995_001777 [Termitomyces sp. Mi166\